MLFGAGESHRFKLYNMSAEENAQTDLIPFQTVLCLHVLNAELHY